jgi:hypothetical protein
MKKPWNPSEPVKNRDDELRSNHNGKTFDKRGNGSNSQRLFAAARYSG